VRLSTVRRFRRWTRHCNCRVLLKRAGATPGTFWAAESRKTGVAPARFGSFPSAAFENPAPDVPLPQNLGRGKGEDLGVERCEGRNSYILHQLPTRSARPSTARLLLGDSKGRAQNCAGHQLEGTNQGLLRRERSRCFDPNEHPRFVHGLSSTNETDASAISIYLFSVWREKCVAQRRKKSEIFKIPDFDKWIGFSMAR